MEFWCGLVGLGACECVFVFKVFFLVVFLKLIRLFLDWSNSFLVWGNSDRGYLFFGKVFY